MTDPMRPMRLSAILDLADHGPDTFVGSGPRYPWGSLYGGQIVAQALRAAANTVEEQFQVHSLRAYFIRRGDHDEPVRYEVDRIRNGRTFCTRCVVARQAVGAILNLEASFQAAEESADVETVGMPIDVPHPDELSIDQWSPVFERAFVNPRSFGDARRDGLGRAAAWLRATETTGDGHHDQACALAYLSDDLPTDAAVRAHPIAKTLGGENPFPFTASLDHTIWFHRPLRTDEWHLHDFSCHTFVGGRGLAIGHVFTESGLHAATIAQEVLLRA